MLNPWVGPHGWAPTGGKKKVERASTPSSPSTSLYPFLSFWFGGRGGGPTRVVFILLLLLLLLVPVAPTRWAGGVGGGCLAMYPPILRWVGPCLLPIGSKGGGAASPCCQHGRLCVVFPLLKAYPASWTSVAHFKKVCRKEDCQGFNKFFKLYQWKLHKLVFHSETWKFTCQICGRRSMHKQNFDSHIKVCENQKKNAVGVPVIGKEKRLGIKGSLPNSLLFPVSLSKQTAVRWIPWQGEFPLAWAQSKFQSLERNRD